VRSRGQTVRGTNLKPSFVSVVVFGTHFHFADLLWLEVGKRREVESRFLNHSRGKRRETK